MNIHRAVIPFIIDSPDLDDEGFSGEDLPRMTGELEQQLKFLERQRQLLTVPDHLVASAVQNQPAQLNHL